MSPVFLISFGNLTQININKPPLGVGETRPELDPLPGCDATDACDPWELLFLGPRVREGMDQVPARGRIPPSELGAIGSSLGNTGKGCDPNSCNKETFVLDRGVDSKNW